MDTKPTRRAISWNQRFARTPDLMAQHLAPGQAMLTHWGGVTHICVGNLTIIGSDNGLSPGRRQAIIWTNAGIVLIGPLGTQISLILMEILTFSFKKMHLKLWSGKCWPFCLGLNELSALWHLAGTLVCVCVCVCVYAIQTNQHIKD